MAVLTYILGKYKTIVIWYYSIICVKSKWNFSKISYWKTLVEQSPSIWHEWFSLREFLERFKRESLDSITISTRKCNFESNYVTSSVQKIFVWWIFETFHMVPLKVTLAKAGFKSVIIHVLHEHCVVILHMIDFKNILFDRMFFNIFFENLTTAAFRTRRTG